MIYSAGNFHMVLANITNIVFQGKMPENIKFSFGHLLVFPQNQKVLSIVLVSEEFNQNTRTYIRSFSDFFVYINSTQKTVRFVEHPYKLKGLNDLKNINNTLELIGVFVKNESVVILFFRFHSTIIYCALDKVSKHI